MGVIQSRLDKNSEAYASAYAHAEKLVSELRDIERRGLNASARAAKRFEKRNQLLPRARLGLLLDAGAPFLELCGMAGYGLKDQPIEQQVAGAGTIVGIGYVAGMRAMIVVDDAAIDAGAAQPGSRDKFQRCQAIAMRERLPFIHLIESAGANLLNYDVEGFIEGGRNFYNLCRMSAMGLPVMGVVHGASTAGGAYMTGLSDYVVMVRGKARAFLAGPPLLKAATGEIADAEELGGADMHAQVSGLAEYVGQDDAESIALMRELCGAITWDRALDRLPEGPAPLYSEEELLGVVPADLRKPVDMREVIARIVDGSEFLEFKALYGPGTVCGHAKICGMEVGVLTNNGPIDPEGASKATHFIQACSQRQTPLIYLQNTTGYLVGKESERGGIIKHGSKMIQAVANCEVPQITIVCGSSFGAGNYGMCGRGFNPNFIFSWPTAKTGVMGAAQAAGTMRVVAEQGAAARNEPVDVAALEMSERRIVERFEGQTSPLYTSARLLDDGVIDPRDTRRVIAMTLATCRAAPQRRLRSVTFGVGRA
jgi:geranyl-CoA carboxylase beta subunit